MAERETVAVALGANKTVTIPLADAIAEYFRLVALNRERPHTDNERRIFAALTLTMGTLNTGNGAQALHDAVAQ